MLDIVDEIRADHKLQRVAAFRQLQGISHQVNLLTSGRMTVDHFELPSTCNVRPVGAHEKREIVNQGERNLHVIVITDAGSRLPVIPLSLVAMARIGTSWPCMTSLAIASTTVLW